MTRPSEQPDEPAFEQYTLSELEEMLQKAVEQEEYEKASKIRDEISKRKED
jgi:protein-arginine kinase activator protein McsA